MRGYKSRVVASSPTVIATSLMNKEFGRPFCVWSVMKSWGIMKSWGKGIESTETLRIERLVRGLVLCPQDKLEGRFE